MTGKLNLVEGQAALVAPGSKITGTSQSTTIVLGVVRGVEWSVGVRLESLKAIPLYVVSFHACQAAGTDYSQSRSAGREECHWCSGACPSYPSR